MPVFPDVGSMITVSLSSFPLASASSIIASPILSLMLAPGLKRSAFIHTSISSPNSELILMQGVFPIVSRILLYFMAKLLLLLLHRLDKGFSFVDGLLHICHQ